MEPQHSSRIAVPSNGQNGNAESRDEELKPRGATVAATATGERRVTGPAAEDIYLWEHGVAVEPWPEPVDGKGLLDEAERQLSRYVVLGKWAAETLALWVVHTYAFQLRQVATYIGVESPEKRCGKTTLLTVLGEMVNRPVVASNISSPAFFRVIEEKAPTLLIDEADTALERNKELKGILNAGYAKKTAYVIRMTPQRGEQETGQESETGRERLGLQLGRFSCWCPKAIATIKHLPETLQDRCIVIHMHRKTANEKCDRLSLLNAGDLRRKCARFVLDHAPDIARARPAVPGDLNDRAADIWEPLLALADLAGGDWPEKARKAALGLTARAQEDSPIGALLLDIMILLLQPACAQGNGGMNGSAGVRIFSRDLVAALNNCTDRPWMVLRRAKDVTERWLSQQLSPYGIRPRTVWIAGTSAKGYLEGDFKEAFRRYIPKAAVQALLEESRAADREKDKIEARQQAVAPAPILPTA